MFLFKKLVAPLLFPLPLCLLLMAAGLALLWFTRRQKAGRIVVTSGFVILVVLSYGAVSTPVMRSLERGYASPAAADVAQAKWVVVLGGGSYADSSVPPGARLTGATLNRLVEGIRLHRQIPGSRLLLSGAPVFGSGSDAQIMLAVALGLGIAPEGIVLDDASPDTETQAVNVARITKGEAFVLVTSANHMPRAVGLFTKAGLNPVPAPTHYLAPARGGVAPGDFYPNVNALALAQVVWNEYLGRAWATLRSRI